MEKGRTEAFSDGVIAIILTIMVLDLKVPGDPSLGGLVAMWPIAFAYVLSFMLIAIMWTNHHHLLAVVRVVDGPLLWWNINLLFWMSLVPFSTAYLGAHPWSALPVGAYGADMCLCSTAFLLLLSTISRQHKSSELSRLDRRMQWKNAGASLLYFSSIPLAWVSVWISFAIFALVPALYFMPQRKLEQHSKTDV